MAVPTNQRLTPSSRLAPVASCGGGVSSFVVVNRSCHTIGDLLPNFPPHQLHVNRGTFVSYPQQPAQPQWVPPQPKPGGGWGKTILIAAVVFIVVLVVTVGVVSSARNNGGTPQAAASSSISASASSSPTSSPSPKLTPSPTHSSPKPATTQAAAVVHAAAPAAQAPAPAAPAPTLAGGSTGGSGSGGGSGTCSIRSNAGNCYSAGEFCRESDLGATTTDADGRSITCVMESGRPHWRYS